MDLVTRSPYDGITGYIVGACGGFKYFRSLNIEKNIVNEKVFSITLGLINENKFHFIVSLMRTRRVSLTKTFYI